MTDQPELLSPDALRRRSFIRGGALVAAAGAGAVVAGAANALPAQAANNDAVTVGNGFTGTATTSLTTTVPPNSPANTVAATTLSLNNSTGATLKLQPLADSFEVTGLKVGEIYNTTYGPYIGVSDGSANGVIATPLATGEDLATISLPFVQTPDRVLDTRTQDGRAGIVSTSGKLDSSGRLKAGQFIDVAIVGAAEQFTVDGIFFNLTVISATSGGYLVAYPSDKSRPPSSTINFTKGATVANGGLVALGRSGDVLAVRLYTTTTTHVALDVTGQLISGIPGPAVNSAPARSLRAAQTRRASRRIQRVSAARR